MRATVVLLTATLTFAAALAQAEECRLTPKEVVTQFMTKFYVDKQVREAFETWVEPGYIQHNPMAQTGRDAAIAFLEPFFKSHPDIHYEIKRIIADGNLVAVHSHGVFIRGSGDSRSSTSCGSITARSPNTGTSRSPYRRNLPIPTGCSDACGSQGPRSSAVAGARARLAHVRSSSSMALPSAAARIAARRSRSIRSRPSGTGSWGRAARHAS